MQHCDRVVQFNRGPYRVRRHNIEESPNNRSKSTVTLGEVAPMTKSSVRTRKVLRLKLKLELEECFTTFSKIDFLQTFQEISSPLSDVWSQT